MEYNNYEDIYIIYSFFFLLLYYYLIKHYYIISNINIGLIIIPPC